MPLPPPSRMVLSTTAGSRGSVLVTVTALPLSPMFSTYVPGNTVTVPPAAQASMAACTLAKASYPHACPPEFHGPSQSSSTQTLVGAAGVFEACGVLPKAPMLARPPLGSGSLEKSDAGSPASMHGL